MWRASRYALAPLIAVLLSGCTFAQYTKVRVHVVDAQTQAGIPKARLRTFYIKPMWDMTYQRKDRERTDRDGFATLTVATNWSQRMILGWTYGIVPYVSVQARGYAPQNVGIRTRGSRAAEPVLIEMVRTNETGAIPSNGNSTGASKVTAP